jgi:hypothetical protein
MASFPGVLRFMGVVAANRDENVDDWVEVDDFLQPPVEIAVTGHMRPAI